MEYRVLGRRAGLRVSRLCFGTLTLGPLQAGLTLEEGAELLAEAYHRGVTFWDTAELYYNYPYLRRAVQKIKEVPVIATKTYAWTRKGARASLEKARRKLDLDYIPIFLLHEQESALTLHGHRPALNFFLEAKLKGLIQAVGISCHTIAAVRAAINFQELDVIHPIINFQGIGIKDGKIEEMLRAVREAFEKGFGIYAMKVLGGGHLIREARKAINYVKNLPFVHSLALGMASKEELEANLLLMEGKELPQSLTLKLGGKKRRLKIEEWCTGCGACIEKCPQGALFLRDGRDSRRAAVDERLCIFCGYCGAACPEFCLKIF